MPHPFPGVLEGHDLGGGAGAVLFGEEDVVVLAAIEGRVEVDEVDRFVFDVAAEDVEVVAVVELVLGHLGGTVPQGNQAQSLGLTLVFVLALACRLGRGSLRVHFSQEAFYACFDPRLAFWGPVLCQFAKWRVACHRDNSNC